jgi:hypothetical protein
MTWYIEGAPFFLSLAGIISALIVVGCQHVLKSRCTSYVCCSRDGFILVKRDSLAENNELQMELDNIPRRHSRAESDV